MTVILLKTFVCIKELALQKAIGQEPLFASDRLNSVSRIRVAIMRSTS